MNDEGKKEDRWLRFSPTPVTKEKPTYLTDGSFIAATTTAKQLVDSSVRSYLDVQEFFAEVAAGKVGRLRLDDEDRSERFTYDQVSWRDTKLFVVAPEEVNDTLRAIVDEHVAAFGRRLGNDLVDPRVHTLLPREEDQAREFARDFLDRLQFPQRMPFSSVFFAFGDGFPMTESLQDDLERKDPGLSVFSGRVSAMLLGLLMVSTPRAGSGDNVDSMCVSFTRWRVPGMPAAKVSVSIVYDSRTVGWDSWTRDDQERKRRGLPAHQAFQLLVADTFLPALAVSLVSTVLSARSVNLEPQRLSGNNRFDRQKASRRMRGPAYVPEAFHIVRMKTQVISRVVKRLMQSGTVDWSCRWDVHGHWMTRVRKGKNPVDPRLEAKLRRRGYAFFRSLAEVDPLSPAWQDLSVRDLRVQPDEWVAVLRSWRRDYVKGPADKPLRKAARLPPPSSGRLP